MQRRPAGPRPLSEAVSEFIAVRGLAQRGARAELESTWRQAAGERIAGRTRVLGLRRGVLQVGVENSSLLGELSGFHKGSLLKTLQENTPHLKIRDLSFRLKSDLQR